MMLIGLSLNLAVLNGIAGGGVAPVWLIEIGDGQATVRANPVDPAAPAITAGDRSASVAA